MHIALIFVPATAYILLTLIFAPRAGVREISEGLVKGHIVIFAFIAFSTEVLSLIHGISFPALLNVWLLFLLVCLVTVFRPGKKHGFNLPVLQRITPLTGFSVGAIALILASTFAAAILYPPNNYDSMTYHMARVAHWISNKSISFYPTAITRQNYQMPLAEFAIMHVQILTGCDLYANLVQWMSFLVLVCLGLLIAGELGLSIRQQLISAIVIATLPMAILQASSTQNDLVVSSFLLSFGLFMLRLREKLSAENLFLAAISLGLALLTKGTAFLYCAAVGISLAVPVLMARVYDRPRLLKATAALSLVVIIALLLNAGQFWRNFQLYGHLLPTEAEGYRNEDISAATLLSNILRNGALHTGIPSARVNWYQYRALQVVLGSQLNNPKTTFGAASFKIRWYRHEDFAGNLIHMFTVLFGVLVLPITWLLGRHTRAIWYAIGVTLGAVLYCGILRWQPWASRLHTPLFTLAAPLLAITITSDIFRVSRRIGLVIILSMVFYSLPFVLANQSRSLVSLEWNHNDRMQLYFANRKNLFNDYNSVMNVLGEADAGDVGLYLGEDDWEYPFWAFARRAGKNGRTMVFRHVGVSNFSRTINEDMLLPLYVIATKSIKTWENASRYAPVYISDHVSVFRKSGHNNSMQTGGNAATLNSRR
jgi:hypothetical protein